jgi:hypothetical protein
LVVTNTPFVEGLEEDAQMNFVTKLNFNNCKNELIAEDQKGLKRYFIDLNGKLIKEEKLI